MNSNYIPKAIELFNRQTNERKQNIRQIIGRKPYRDNSSGLYGTDFSCETPVVDRSDYVPCLEKICSFRGPVGMMELHNRTVHEMGLSKELNIDNETWIKNRQKKFPSSSKPKEVKAVEEVKEKPKPSNDKKAWKKANKKRKAFQKIDSEHSTQPIEDPLSILLSKKLKEESNTDILGLSANYHSSGDEESPTKQVEDSPYSGLPLPEELSEKQLHTRKNKFRFPILPQMELQEKRRVMMNPQRRYLENHSRKMKRPRLAHIMCAEELNSDRSVVLQCIRYLCNRRFFDDRLAATLVVADEREVEKEDEEELFEMEEASSGSEIEDGEIWSDDDM